MRMLTRMHLELDYRSSQPGMPVRKTASAPAKVPATLPRSHQPPRCHPADQAETAMPRKGRTMPLVPCLGAVPPALQAQRHPAGVRPVGHHEPSAQQPPACSVTGMEHAAVGQVQDCVSHPADFCRAIAGRYDCGILASGSSRDSIC